MSESRKIGAFLAPLGVIAAVGIAAWLVSFAAFDKPAWGIFLASFMFFTSMTQGVLGIAVILRFTSAKWSANFFRLATTTAVAFFPVALGMLVVLLVFRDSVFFWAAEPVHNPWFNPYFFIGRNLAVLFAFYAVARMLHNYGTEENKPPQTATIADSEDVQEDLLLAVPVALVDPWALVALRMGGEVSVVLKAFLLSMPVLLAAVFAYPARGARNTLIVRRASDVLIMFSATVGSYYLIYEVLLRA